MTLIPEMLSGFRNNKKDRKVKTDRLQELLSLTSRGAGMLIFFVELLICCLLATQDKEDPLCGPKCLLFICKELGVEANLEELTRLSGFIPGKGTTMLGLHNAATKKGLFAAGLKIGLNDLILKKEPSIAYLWDGHFVVVEKTDFESEVAVGVDFLKNVPINEFRNIYSGFVLLVSNHELSFPGKTREGPDIRFEEYNFNWGVVAQGRKIKHIFRFKNVGTQKLVISKVRSSCGCALVSSSAKEIAPGGKGFLRVIVDPAGRFGPQEYRIYVHSNDPISPLI
ncbi:MAG: DUF1573 domain-containing protein, partial [Candidatus Omnitrophica bacterium]|nr:DUF1573 domain-containing protein [Candidatus Omnitrophota bacterium]